MQTNYIGQQLAEYIAPNNEKIQIIVKRLSDQLAQGHTCITLQPKEQALFVDFSSEALTVEGNLLYLTRYASYEKQLAQDLLRLSRLSSIVLRVDLDEQLGQYFKDDQQKKAAALALTKQLAIITGGPGTGKTTTVVKILALLLTENPKLRIALAAPTGKAAMRLSESIATSLANHDVMKGFENVKDRVPTQAKTLHSLLGARPLTTEFRHNKDNPLLEDVVVVDEASMIDLAMMTKLVQSLKPTTKLILLGDKDQLASVESGAVLADCYEALQDNRVELTHTYRFEGAIKDLAVLVNQQSTEEVINLFSHVNDNKKIAWETDTKVVQSFIKHNLKAYSEIVKTIETRENIERCFEVFNHFQMLCAMRQGKSGVETLNYLAENAFFTQEKRGSWYVGRPVMITRNDASTGLSNGDIGLCLPSPEHDNQLRVFFRQGNLLSSFLPARLPNHETAFAITIHKSQGSEFAHVMIVLPDDKEQETTTEKNNLLTKELLYTAITRAKKRVTLVSSEITLRNTIEKDIRRESGLKKRLSSEISVKV